MEGEGWSLIPREWDLETAVETKSHKERRCRRGRGCETSVGRRGPDSRQRPANPDGGAARRRWGDAQK